MTTQEPHEQSPPETWSSGIGVCEKLYRTPAPHSAVHRECFVSHPQTAKGTVSHSDLCCKCCHPRQSGWVCSTCQTGRNEESGTCQPWTSPRVLWSCSGRAPSLILYSLFPPPSFQRTRGLLQGPLDRSMRASWAQLHSVLTAF